MPCHLSHGLEVKGVTRPSVVDTATGTLEGVVVARLFVSVPATRQRCLGLKRLVMLITKVCARGVLALTCNRGTGQYSGHNALWRVIWS